MGEWAVGADNLLIWTCGFCTFHMMMCKENTSTALMVFVLHLLIRNENISTELVIFV